MKQMETKVTEKYQTTIPEGVRKFLNIKAGNRVEWGIVKSIVILSAPRKFKDPVKFLTSQIKTGIDAVSLIRKSREDFE